MGKSDSTRPGPLVFIPHAVASRSLPPLLRALPARRDDRRVRRRLRPSKASEVFVHQDLIYDVGMNNGDDTAYYLRRGFRVVAIEADTRLAKYAGERFGTQISSGQLRILNIGIAAEE